MQSLSRSLLTTAALLMAVVVCLLAGAAPQHPAITRATAAKPSALHHAVDDAAAVAPISLSDADGQELILEDLSVRTAIHGMLSLTELELRFRNPKAKRIEGRFACTLPANAAISRFAKEVNG